MDREQALEALKLRVEKQENIKHSLAVEAVMRKLAEFFHDDMDQWGIAGLVHDIDIERIKNNAAIHGMLGGDILEGLDFDETIVYAVRSHNPNNNYARRRRIDKALFCASPMCRLIFSCMKAMPRKGLKNIDKAAVIKCYQDKDFAPSVMRDQISSCLELEISLESFIELSIKALQGISGKLE